jgi:hypothetical protein
MKTKETVEKDMIVVYRKDGKTPDLRYKSSRDFVLAQNLEKTRKQVKVGKTSDFKYKSFRDNALSKQTEKNKINPVQIKPVGKKPLWKVSS